MKNVILHFAAITLFLCHHIMVAQTITATKIPYTSGSTAGTHDNAYQYSVDIPDRPAPRTPRNNFLWIFGDGGFSFENAPTYTFTELPMHDPFLSVTPIKDDKEDPYEVINIAGFSSPTKLPSTRPNDRIDMDNHIRMISNNSPRAGDTTIYILTYQNCGAEEPTGTLTFTYPNTMSLVKEWHYFENDPPPPVTMGSDKVLTWTIPATAAMKAGEQRNIFVFLEADDSLLPGELIHTQFDWLPTPTTSSGCPTESGTSLTKKAVKSHDPNYIHNETLETLACSANDIMLEYTIHFKNEGTGPATTVTLYNVIDTGLAVQGINTLETKFDSNPNTSGLTSISKTGRVITWELHSLNLRGTKEAGYGTTFTDEDTEGWLTYEIPAKGVVNCCLSILNQAAIVFDCNPPIYTNTHITPVQCSEPCSTTEILMDTLTQDIALPHHDFNIGDPYGILDHTKKWYPNPEIPGHATLMIHPDAGATLTIDNPTDYAFLWGFNHSVVASTFNMGLCEQRIFMQPLVLDCPYWEVHSSVIINCNDPSLNKLTAQLRDVNDIAVSDIIWYDCSTNDEFCLNDPSIGWHNISAKDMVGCTISERVWAGPTLPLWADLVINPHTCEIEARVSGDFTAPLSYLWSNSANSSSIPLVALATESVTVTDANGCSAHNTISIPNDIAQLCYPLGTSNLADSDDAAIQLFPNPNNGQFTIHSKLEFMDPTTIILYNAIGQRILNQYFQAHALSNQKLSIPNLSKGIYLLEVRSKQGRMAKKFLVQ